MERVTIYNPFIPNSQYKKENLLSLPLLKSEIVDIQDAIFKNKGQVEQLQKQVQDLTQVKINLE